MRGKKIGFVLLLCLAGMGSALAQAKLTPQQENVLKSMVDATAEAYQGGHQTSIHYRGGPRAVKQQAEKVKQNTIAIANTGKLRSDRSRVSDESRDLLFFAILASALMPETLCQNYDEACRNAVAADQLWDTSLSEEEQKVRETRAIEQLKAIGFTEEELRFDAH